MNIIKNKRILWIAVVSAVIIGFLCRMFLIWSKGIVFDRILALLYDDAYFGFGIARHIALGNGVTYDGYSLTNGFQPLWVFLQVPFFWLEKTNLITPLKGIVTLGSIFNAGALFFIAKTIYHYTKSLSSILLAVIVYYFSAPVIMLELSGLESPFLALAFSYFLYYFLCVFQKNTTAPWKDAIMFGIISGLTMFARIDTVITVGLVLLSVLIIQCSKKVFLQTVVVGLCATAILSPWLIWNYTVFGSILPVSGKAGYPMLGISTYVRNYGTLFHPHVICEGCMRVFTALISKKALILFFVPLAVYLYLIFVKKSNSSPVISFLKKILVPLVGIFLTLAIHGFFRMVIRDWYWVPFLCAGSVFMVVSIYFVQGSTHSTRPSGLLRVTIKKYLFSILCVIFIAYCIISLYQRKVLKNWITIIPPKETVQAFAIRDMFKDDQNRWGGVSIGAIGYLSGKSVNNLEGKVNNTAYEYIMQKKLDVYIKKSHIRYIINYDELYQYLPFMQHDIIAESTQVTVQTPYAIPLPILKIDTLNLL